MLNSVVEVLSVCLERGKEQANILGSGNVFPQRCGIGILVISAGRRAETRGPHFKCTQCVLVCGSPIIQIKVQGWTLRRSSAGDLGGGAGGGRISKDYFNKQQTRTVLRNQKKTRLLPKCRAFLNL